MGYDGVASMTQAQTEDSLVERIARQIGRRSSRPSLAVGLGDDAALWKPARGHEIVLTCDWFLEGTHFLRDKHPADAVGWKCLARAVSDIAAMGGNARCFLLSLALPNELTGKWLDEFLRGLKRASKTLGCEAAGGDTTRRDKVLINVTVIGEVRTGSALLRSGALPGDGIYVSGTLGEADLGLRLLRAGGGRAKRSKAALRKHLYPEPRLALGQWLAANRLATAAMDISDGLSTDLPRLCAASGVGARVDIEELPISTLATRAEARELALHGGDEYELLFTVSAGNKRKLHKRFRGLRLTRIGEITKQKKVMVRAAAGIKPLTSAGWDPFR